MSRRTHWLGLRASRVVAAAPAVAFLCGCVLLLPSAGSAGVIDDFTDAPTTRTPQTLDHGTGRSRAATDGDAVKGVFGGTRRLTINSNWVLAGTGDAISAWVDPATQRVEYAGSLTAGGSLELVYDASGRGLNVDWGAIKGIGILFNADVSAVPYKVTLTITDKSANAAASTQTVNADGTQEVDFLLSSLRGANLRKVTRLALLIEPQTAGDLEVTKIVTIDK